jgi:ParB family chromosome partitioning protein
MKKQKTIAKKWKISKLKDHPQQAALFGDVSEPELKALVKKIQKEGFRDPVEIQSDGTIITGHQRVRAAKVLGWTEIDVEIRSDLEAAGPEAVEQHFISDNFIRRQLSQLARHTQA